jgi:hypothetical protein
MLSKEVFRISSWVFVELTAVIKKIYQKSFLKNIFIFFCDVPFNKRANLIKHSTLVTVGMV